MFKDYCLKFGTQEEAQAVMYDTDPEGKLSPKFVNIVVLGTLLADPLDPESPALPGYHINVRVDAPVSELDPYEVFPKYPRNIFLGSSAENGI